MVNGWLRPEQAAAYASISRRTLYVWFDQGLKFSKVGQIRLVKRENLDSFLEGFANESGATDRIVEDVLLEMNIR